MRSGFIKLHRSIEDWEWIDDQTMFFFWGRILLMANWEDKKIQGQTIPRGSFVTSYRELAKRLKLSLQQVRTCIDRLKASEQIVVKSTHLPTRYATQISICNYASYQDAQHSDNTVNDTVATQFTDNTLYKNKEEDKEIKDNTARARMREDWRHLSSARINYLRTNGQSIADFKRFLLLEEVKEVATGIGLSKSDIEAFMNKWGESSPGSDKIRAEYEPTFNVAERAKNYVGVGKPIRPKVKTAQELIQEEMAQLQKQKAERASHEKRN